MSTESVWQTVGPFFHKTLPWEGGGLMARQGVQGQRIRLIMSIFDGLGATVSDGMVEVWQADAKGAFHHPDDTQKKLPDPHFSNFGRAIADADGNFAFDTVLPGRVPSLGTTLQAPHVNVGIFARGLVRRLVTRIYFSGEVDNEVDPLLSTIEPNRRNTLMARQEPDSPGEWRWSARLQGSDETVFFFV